MNWVHIFTDIITFCLFCLIPTSVSLLDTMGILLISIAIAFGLNGRMTCTQYDTKQYCKTIQSPTMQVECWYILYFQVQSMKQLIAS